MLPVKGSIFYYKAHPPSFYCQSKYVKTQATKQTSLPPQLHRPPQNPARRIYVPGSNDECVSRRGNFSFAGRSAIETVNRYRIIADRESRNLKDNIFIHAHLAILRKLKEITGLAGVNHEMVIQPNPRVYRVSHNVPFPVYQGFPALTFLAGAYTY